MSERDEDKQLRQDVLDALTTVQDPGMRIVLMLLHRSLESINLKLDRVLSDEAKLKSIVLNGGAATHTDEHHWMREFIAEWTEYKPLMDVLKDRHRNGGYCDYAKRMLEAEKDDANSRRKIRDDIAGKVLFGILMVILGAISTKYLGL